MPIYEFECKSHGVFTTNKPLKEYQKPAKCPKCKKDSPRIIATAVPKSKSWRAY